LSHDQENPLVLTSTLPTSSPSTPSPPPPGLLPTTTPTVPLLLARRKRRRRRGHRVIPLYSMRLSPHRLMRCMGGEEEEEEEGDRTHPPSLCWRYMGMHWPMD